MRSAYSSYPSKWWFVYLQDRMDMLRPRQVRAAAPALGVAILEPPRFLRIQEGAFSEHCRCVYLQIVKN